MVDVKCKVFRSNKMMLDLDKEEKFRSSSDEFAHFVYTYLLQS